METLVDNLLDSFAGIGNGQIPSQYQGFLSPLQAFDSAKTELAQAQANYAQRRTDLRNAILAFTRQFKGQGRR